MAAHPSGRRGAPAFQRSALIAALATAGLIGCNDVHAVRVNADGHGQALIYPYYTARSTVSGNAFVTAMTVINVAPAPKAVKVRFLESTAGASVLGFNLFLAAYDVWTAGVVGAGSGAGIFTSDHSCTSPQVSRSSASPTLFRNGAFIGDGLGDSLDRTYEGYFEILEMGTIDAAGALGVAVTPRADLSAPNASRPPCNDLPVSDTMPTALTRPTGGLIGAASYLNINEGTDYNADAIALSQWSDKVQWSGPGSDHPNLADASPTVSHVVDSTESADKLYLTTWTTGRDAVTALFMTDRLRNDYTVEPIIKAATDWVVAIPTKRFHVSRARADAPFQVRQAPSDSTQYHCQPINQFDSPIAYYDRESQTPGPIVNFSTHTPESYSLCGAVAVLTLSANGGVTPISRLFQARTVTNVALNSTWINGWVDLVIDFQLPGLNGGVVETSMLVAPRGATTTVDLATGAVASGMTATYFGLPAIGFAAQSYSTTGLPGVAANVLSNYGGSFIHKVFRRIEIGP